MESNIYVNKKKGTFYRVIGEAINCTNAQDGQEMIIYTDGKLTFVREKAEFNIKFEKA